MILRQRKDRKFCKALESWPKKVQQPTFSHKQHKTLHFKTFWKKTSSICPTLPHTLWRVWTPKTYLNHLLRKIVGRLGFHNVLFHTFFCCLWKAENWMKEQWYKPGWEPLAGFSLDVATTMAFYFCLLGKRRIIRTAFFGGNVIWDLSLMKYGLGRCRCHVFQRNSCLFGFIVDPGKVSVGGKTIF